jgi:hypothetical protein
MKPGIANAQANKSPPSRQCNRARKPKNQDRAKDSKKKADPVQLVTSLRLAVLHSAENLAGLALEARCCVLGGKLAGLVAILAVNLCKRDR